MFYFENGVASHMPFAAPDPLNDFSPREFCCIMVSGKWKIHQFKNGAWIRIHTGMPEDATECSPAAECLNGVWHLTFIAGGAEASRMFRLYHICDLDGGVAPVAVCPADVGFIQKKRLVSGDRHGIVTIDAPGNITQFHFTDAEYLYRVTYDPFNPNRLLISGQISGGNIFSRIYSPMTNELFSVTADGVPAYKAAFWQNLCFYAHQTGEGFEDREIVQAVRMRIAPMNTNEFIIKTVISNKRTAGNIDGEFE